MNALDALLLIGMSLLLGVAVPWAGVAMLAPALQESERAAVSNYRGWRVFYGLGVVWLIWAGSAVVAGIAAQAIASEGSVLVVLVLASPLALIAFALGLFDDAYGSSASRGFRGHLRALAAGRLTTGGMKLFGISAASYVIAVLLWDVSPWGASNELADSMALLMALLMALPAGAAIALTSNLLNLTDLRPGRALKAYSILAVLGVVSLILGVGKGFLQDDVALIVDGVCLLIFALGPVLAVWRFDVREWGMLGDAGANPMGAVAGLFIVAGLPPLGLAVYLVVVAALNVASERVSFSAIIERNALLSKLDAFGRLPETEPGDESKSSHQSEGRAE